MPSNDPAGLIRPAWQAPAAVGALMTTRSGGVSAGSYASLNVGVAVGDDPACVAENRRRVAAWAGVPLVYLRQVHGERVVRLVPGRQADEPIEADASWTDAPGLACAIQVADCMPVLFAAGNGAAVGAAHAGWRGLAAGVLERTLEAVCAAAGCAPAELHAWMGPCIGPEACTVGDASRFFSFRRERVTGRMVAAVWRR